MTTHPAGGADEPQQNGDWLADELAKAGYGSLDELATAAADQSVRRASGETSWREVEEALRSLGAEDHIARRLKSLRQRAGLSQEQLAKRLDALGVQMPQSSISKIEVPVEAGAGKRRDITVDEALALAKALDVSLIELLLPDNVTRDLDLHRLVARGAELYAEKAALDTQYSLAVRQVAEAARESLDWRASLQQQRDDLARRRTDHGAPAPTVSSVAQQGFLDDVLAHLNKEDLP